MMQVVSRTCKMLLTGLLVYLACVALANADVFQSVDAHGVVHLSNVPAGRGYRVMLRDARPRKPHIHHRSRKKTTSHSTDIRHTVSEAAHEQNLDQALLRAVIAAESGFDPTVVSSKGAVGLMQLMPATARRYGVKDRFDPQQNIHAGARYLHDLMNKFHENLPLVLAAYNAGEHAVHHYGNHIPPYPETRQYVPRVLSLYRYYQLASH